MLTVNDERFIERAEIIREKGTNRSKFLRGELAKYDWMDVGSSFLPSEMIAAFLFAQLEQLDLIQKKRKQIWEIYHDGLKELTAISTITLSYIPDYATNNGNSFYILCKDLQERMRFIYYLNSMGVSAAFHYLPLHKSPFYHNKHDGRELPNTDKFSDCLVRLPFYYDLTESDQKYIIDSVYRFYK